MTLCHGCASDYDENIIKIFDRANRNNVEIEYIKINIGLNVVSDDFSLFGQSSGPVNT